MKSNQSNIIPITLAVAFSIALFTGCASKSYDKGTATSQAIQASADEVAVLNTRTTDALGALNELTFKSQGDLRKQLDKFNSAVKGLSTSSAALEAKVTEMQVRAQVYFDTWSNQIGGIGSESIRALSTERKADVSAKLNAATASYSGVRDSLKPFTSDLTDIQTYLNNDLTAGGVAAIKDTVAKTKADAVPVRDSIRKLQSDFSALAAALSPVVPANK